MTTAAAAAWLTDPTGRHPLRYWDGRAWTSYVADDGVQSEDPLPAYDEQAEQATATPEQVDAEPEQTAARQTPGQQPSPSQPRHTAEEMADITLRVSPAEARDAVAQELTSKGFRMAFVGDWYATAERGSKAGNIAFGGWAQYFRITLEIFDAGEGNTTIRLLRDPVGYWGGWMGRAKVSGMFKTVVNDLVGAFHARGLLVGVDHRG